MVSDFVRQIRDIDRAQQAVAAIDATGFCRIGESNLLEGLPEGEGRETDLFFFQPDWSRVGKDGFSADEIGGEYDQRALKPDPRAQIQANRADALLADAYWNASVWQEPGGKWRSLFFRYLGTREHAGSPRYAYVLSETKRWNNPRVWFCGVRK